MVAQLGNRRKYRVTLGIGSNVASLAVGAAAAAAIVVGAAVLVPQFAPEQVDEAAELSRSKF